LALIDGLAPRERMALFILQQIPFQDALQILPMPDSILGASPAWLSRLSTHRLRRHGVAAQFVERLL
jgi:hypothetical protein